MKFKEYIEAYLIEQCEPYILELHQVKMQKAEKYKKMNPKTNRIKTFRKTRYVSTKIEVGDRSLKNVPKYSDGKAKVNFKDWLDIKGDGYGKAANGKWYGWSHRAVYGFKPGDKVSGDSLGKKVTYPKLPDGSTDWDNGDFEKDFIIKNDDHAQQVAKTFHGNVA